MMLIISSRYRKVACVVVQVVSGCDHDMNFIGLEIESHADLFFGGLCFYFNTFFITLSLLFIMAYGWIFPAHYCNKYNCLVLYWLSWLV